MPQVGSTKFNVAFGSLIGGTLYPFGVSFLLPLFVIVLVQEKEYRILVMMKMNGIKSWTYYLSHYITFYVLYVISTFLFLITGKGMDLSFFTTTETGVLVLLFFVWGAFSLIQDTTRSRLHSSSQLCSAKADWP